MVYMILKTFFSTYRITAECVLTTISIHISGIQYHNLLEVLIISFECKLRIGLLTPEKKTDENW